jgi:uncharacterized phage protein gp47/JayE
MSCRCDRVIHPAALRIPAGLEWIPRQIAGFPEFRRAMLSEIRSRAPLAAWRAREEDDLGVMLLELWAYLADSLAFYDSVIANEAYLRTARLRPSVRRLTALLGYVPRPAVAATVVLAAAVDGRQPLVIPAGTQFRSGAFDGNPPQVFELDADTVVHPFANRWRIEAQTPARAAQAAGWTGSGLASLELEGTPRPLAAGSALLIRVGAAATGHARRAIQVTRVSAEGRTATRVTLDREVALSGTTSLADVAVSSPTQTAGLWPYAAVGSDPAVITTASPAGLILDGLHRQIRPGDDLIVSKGTDHRWFRVDKVEEVTMHLTAGGSISTTNADGDPVTVSAPPVLAPATRLTLDAGLNAPDRKTPGAADWGASDRSQLTVRYGFVPLGAATALPTDEVTVSEPMVLSPPTRTARLELPDEPPTRFIVRDRDDAALDSSGVLDAGGTLALTGDAAWGVTLKAPIDVFGNLLIASRGETVLDEVLGSGDASIPNQSFTLAKAPLTYVPAAAGDGRGIASTLTIRVDGVQWREVPSFYGAGPLDPVFIVRQNDAGETIVTFGDGVRGRRLPTGRDNVRASYRYGAGAAAPPAGSVTQLARPVDGLRSVTNPLAAAGGADAESPDEIRTLAPRSALLLGRAVSLADFEAAAAGLPGVRAVKAEWRWHGTRQRPVASLRYIGDAVLAADIARSVRRIAEPGAPIVVEPADPVPLTLTLDIEVDPAYRHEEVFAAVEEALTGEGGMLTPERIGIGAPLYRSALFERVLRVPGTVAVQQILVDGAPFQGLAITPGAGNYFDIESGGLELHLWEATDG